MKDFTFLTVEQCCNRDNPKGELNIFHKRGQEAKVTDFSVLLGASLFSTYDFEEINYNSVDSRGYYWTKTEDDTPHKGKRVYVHSGQSSIIREEPTVLDKGARIVLPYRSLDEIPTNGKPPYKAKDGIVEVEYGFYPQDAVSKDQEEALDNLLANNKLQQVFRETGNQYTVQSWGTKNAYSSDISLNGTLRFKEYRYKDERFIRVSPLISPNDKVTLSNGRTYYSSSYAWIKVMPIKWWVDWREKVMVSEKILFSGIPYNKNQYSISGFDNSTIKTFINKYFEQDILKARDKELNEQDLIMERDIELETNGNNANKSLKRNNPYGFEFKDVTEEDIIRGSIEAGVAVFLHGKSGEGKSARVKQIDPDPVIVYLRNASPEILNGKTAYNQETGEMIDAKPTWLTKLEDKCEKEKDKIHILFFDELTNARPSVQGMAFNVVLDREVNGKWKLPDNARIVAAGNDLEESLAANEMAEPLFNRFAHVYINTTTDSWLTWAASPKGQYNQIDYKEQESQMNIHPSIYAYIAYKSYRGNDVLRTRYNGKTPNADPRKWEMASKVLYATKNPQMLRGLIGEELTEEFTEFCKTQTISVEDVLNDRIDVENLELNIAEKYSTAVGLCSVDEENVEKIRTFLSNFGKEIVSTFDNLWIHGDESRLEKIAEIRQIEIEKEMEERTPVSQDDLDNEINYHSNDTVKPLSRDIDEINRNRRKYRKFRENMERDDDI